jgi:hypothetical protein
MIDMKCPTCGVAGRVPKDKLNTRLVCRKCMGVFHLTSTGRVMKGEPPQPAAAAKKAKEDRKSEQSAFGLDLSLDVPPWMSRLFGPVFSPRVLAVVGAVLLLVGGYYLVSLLRGESLEERTGKLARAAVIGDLGTLLELTATGTGDDMIKWYTAVRPQCDQFKGLLRTPEPPVEVKINKEDTSTGTAEVVARINADLPGLPPASTSPGAPPSPYSTARSIELPLMLTSEGMGGWMLDGKRTLEAVPKKSAAGTNRSPAPGG